MLKVIDKEQQDILIKMSDKYLKTKDTTRQSLEIEDVTESTVYFWKYDANAEDGDQVDLPWLQFVMFQLFPIMFKNQLFKFNAVAAKYFFRPEEKKEDLFKGLVEFDEYMEEKKKESVKELTKQGKAAKSQS